MNKFHILETINIPSAKSKPVKTTTGGKMKKDKKEKSNDSTHPKG